MAEYAHNVLAPKLTKKQRALLFKYFTILFSDGFESGDFGAWTGTNGAPSVTSGNAHHGTYKTIIDADLEYAYKTYTATATIYVRAYVNFQVLPPANADYARLLNVRKAGVAILAALVITKSVGVIKWQLDYRHAGALNSVLSSQQTGATTGVWYAIELEVKCSTADGNLDGEYHVWIDGSELTDIAKTSMDTDYTASDEFYFGHRMGGAITWWGDCVVVADTGPIGPEVAAVKGFGNGLTWVSY